MNKIELAEGIVQYMFEPDPGKDIGYNIIAVSDGNRVILIDTAYEKQMEQALEDLRANGMEPQAVIISHFHEDHIYGLKALPKLPVYGSSEYKVTLDLYTEKEEHQYFTPAVPVDSSLTMDFGKHRLTLRPYPGHSHCGLLVMIDDSFVHIGDELIAANDGRAALPSVNYDQVREHYEALAKLQGYCKYTLIPSHGLAISGEERIREEIRNRMAYLAAILNSSERITVEEATKGCSREFLCKHWHEHIYE